MVSEALDPLPLYQSKLVNYGSLLKIVATGASVVVVYLPRKSFSYCESNFPTLHAWKAGGYLTLDETTIIAGALDLTEKVSWLHI